MFNRSSLGSNSLLLFFSIFIMVLSCEEERVMLKFSEKTIETTDAATVAVTYPKADDSEIGKRINKVVEHYIARQIFMGEDVPDDLSIDEAILQFDAEYTSFKNEFPEASSTWEALIDGEVTYKSEEFICVAITAYQDTGGAHGNTYVYFMNFDGQTGKQIKRKELITDMDSFSKLVESYLSKEVKSTVNDETDENFFFGEGFKLPESIGFTDKGVFILYNTYEIAAYAQGITEFAIPFKEVNSYLAFDF